VREPELASREIQGNIWPGFNTAGMMLLGLRIDPTGHDAARLWLSGLAPLVTTMADAWHAREVRRAVAKATGEAPPRHDIFLNVALSHRALVPLGLSTAALPPGLFQAGMAHADLQDPLGPDGRPAGWVSGASDDEIDVLLIVGADDAGALTDAFSVLKSRTGPGSGLLPVYEERGDRLPEDREHFGFRDGLSQPGLRGRLSDHPESFVTRRQLAPDDPLSERFAKPGQPLLWPGQFLFGYPAQDEFSEEPGLIARPPEPWMANGSFLVFRRLRQDVAAFRAFSRREAEAAAAQAGRTVTPAEVEAWIVGRWPDGSPLVRCPAAPCGSEGEQSLNHFDYQDAVPAATVHTPAGPVAVTGAQGDISGGRCPHFAHVRKVNLRDKPTDVRPSMFFRIIRRGIPYGPPWKEGETEVPDRGLLFLSYQRDLNQFMTLSALWMNQRTSPETDAGHDLLVGQRRTGLREAVRTLPDGKVVRLESPEGERWVIPTGGGFFFAPARSVLQHLTPSTEILT
jgi:Dyp-type peroxidase family